MDIVIPQGTAPRAAGSAPAPPVAHRTDARSFDRVLSSSVEDQEPRTAGTADRPETNGRGEAQPAPAVRGVRAAAKRTAGNPKTGATHPPTRPGASATPSAAVSNRPGVASRPEGENEPRGPVAGSESGPWLVMANPTESTPAPVDLAGPGGLPALLLIALTTPVDGSGASAQDATTGSQADEAPPAGASGSAIAAGSGAADTPGASAANVLQAGTATAVAAGATGSALGGAPVVDGSQADSDAAATMPADDLAAATSASPTDVGESDTAENGARPGQAAATTLDAATRGAGHAARQLAHQVLGQAVAVARPEGTSSRQAAGETPARIATAAGPPSVAPVAATAAEPVRPGRTAIDARLRAGSANSDNAPAAVAPFLVPADDAGQDQRGGASRGGHAWSSSWPLALETQARAAKPGSGVSASAPFSIAVPIEPAASFVTTLASAVSAGEASAGPEQAPPADAEMARQVVRAVSLAWHDQVGEARLHLTPEHLGDVTVSLRVERGIVSAVLQADTAAARDWIRLHENDLRQGLEGQGLHLDSMVVTEDGTSQGRHEQQQAPPRRQRPVPANRAADGPRFEIRA